MLKLNQLSLLAMAATISVAVALSGCGGGGTGAELGGPSPTPEPELAPATGLTRNMSPPVHATDVNDALDNLGPDSTNLFAPLAAAVKRTFGDAPRSELSDEFHVEAISSDGANGFRVTYVVDEEERTVLLEESDFGADEDYPAEYFKRRDGARYWLWSYTNTFYNGAEKNRGSTEFRYFDALGLSHYSEEEDVSRRTILTYGARTEAVPAAGSATYLGRVYADVWDRDEPASGSRIRMQGYLNLIADFTGSTLAGHVGRIRMLNPGQDAYSRLPDTTRVEIDDGEIVNGQFTADLTGVDSNPNAPLVSSVRGFKGDMLGEFYGPASEEVGGVFNASREEDGLVAQGWFGGGISPAFDDSEPVSATLEGDLETARVADSDRHRVKAISRDGAGGLRLTYVIDGVEREVALGESDLGAGDSAFWRQYSKTLGTQRYWAWFGAIANPSIHGISEFDHFDVGAWSVGNYADESGNDLESWRRGYVVFGDRTEDIPTAGTATYAGRMEAEEWLPENPRFSTRNRWRGDLNLMADFSASTVGGEINRLERLAANGQWEEASGALMLDSGLIQGNALSATLTGNGFTGDASGGFFGPAAAEVGGVLQATHTNGNLLNGWFGGDKE